MGKGKSERMSGDNMDEKKSVKDQILEILKRFKLSKDVYGIRVQGRLNNANTWCSKYSLTHTESEFDLIDDLVADTIVDKIMIVYIGKFDCFKSDYMDITHEISF